MMKAEHGIDFELTHIILQLCVIIAQSDVTWYYKQHRAQAVLESKFVLTDDAPYLVLTGEPWVIKLWGYLRKLAALKWHS